MVTHIEGKRQNVLSHARVMVIVVGSNLKLSCLFWRYFYALHKISHNAQGQMHAGAIRECGSVRAIQSMDYLSVQAQKPNNSLHLYYSYYFAGPRCQ